MSGKRAVKTDPETRKKRKIYKETAQEVRDFFCALGKLRLNAGRAEDSVEQLFNNICAARKENPEAPSKVMEDTLAEVQRVIHQWSEKLERIQSDVAVMGGDANVAADDVMRANGDEANLDESELNSEVSESEGSLKDFIVKDEQDEKSEFTEG